MLYHYQCSRIPPLRYSSGACLDCPSDACRVESRARPDSSPVRRKTSPQIWAAVERIAVLSMASTIRSTYNPQNPQSTAASAGYVPSLMAYIPLLRYLDRFLVDSASSMPPLLVGIRPLSVSQRQPLALRHVVPPWPLSLVVLRQRVGPSPLDFHSHLSLLPRSPSSISDSTFYSSDLQSGQRLIAKIPDCQRGQAVESRKHVDGS